MEIKTEEEKEEMRDNLKHTYSKELMAINKVLEGEIKIVDQLKQKTTGI